MLTGLSSLGLALVVAAITLRGDGAGDLDRLCPPSRRRSGLKEPLGIMRRTRRLVALLLAFGLTMAVGRYEARRNAVVLEANAIGTTYLRAQTLEEPMRTESLDLLKRTATPRSRCPNRFRTRQGSEAAVEGVGRHPEPLVGPRG